MYVLYIYIYTETDRPRPVNLVVAFVYKFIYTDWLRTNIIRDVDFFKHFYRTLQFRVRLSCFNHLLQVLYLLSFGDVQKCRQYGSEVN